MDTKLQEIKANIEKLDREYREIKGYGEDCSKPCPAEVQDVMYQLIRNVYNYIDNSLNYVHTRISDLKENHTLLPKLTPSQLEKLLKAAGAGDDFDVLRRSVFASKNRNGKLQFEVDCTKKS